MHEQDLRSLIEHRILDTPKDGEFDHCARLVAHICGTEIGAVTLIDLDGQRIKAIYGPLPRTTRHCSAFCSLAILHRGVMEVADTHLDPRFTNDPLVTSEPFVRFYAGVAMHSRHGLPLGAICVMDRRAQTLTASQIQALEIAASHIAAQLEMRLGVLRLLEQRSLAKAQRDAIEQATARQKELATLLVHDLRTPVATVTANSRFLAEEAFLSLEQQSALQDIIDAGEKLAAMLNDLLQVSRSEDGHLMVQRTASLDLADVVRRAISQTRAVAAQRGVRVELDPGPSSGIVDGDAELLFRVTTNLLDNAYKYSPLGSTINVTLSVVDDSAVLRLADEGTGIPQRHRHLVFDKYFQVDQEAATRPSFGLGLAFCKLAVEAHHGSIEVEEVAQGCSFKVTLPLAGTWLPAAAISSVVDIRDKELSEKEMLAQADADALIELARELADEVLSAARRREDRKLDRDNATRVTREAVEKERLVADHVLADARTDADYKLETERDASQSQPEEHVRPEPPSDAVSGIALVGSSRKN